MVEENSVVENVVVEENSVVATVEIVAVDSVVIVVDMHQKNTKLL